MMTFAATREQRDNLEGLAYWVSDRAWSRERGKLDEYEVCRELLGGGLAAHDERGSARRDARKADHTLI